MSEWARARQFVADMLEHALYVQSFVQDASLESFESDLVVQFAVVRALEVIGEAAKGVPNEVRGLAPGLPWGQMTSMRDKLIHRYVGIDIGIVWETAVTDIPDLIVALGKLLDLLDSGSGSAS